MNSTTARIVAVRPMADFQITSHFLVTKDGLSTFSVFPAQGTPVETLKHWWEHRDSLIGMALEYYPLSVVRLRPDLERIQPTPVEEALDEDEPAP